METFKLVEIGDALLSVRYQVPRYSGWKPHWFTRFTTNVSGSDTKYRDIADGNHKKPTKGRVYHSPSDTKYRDIADGNEITVHSHGLVCKSQIPSTAI